MPRSLWYWYGYADMYLLCLLCTCIVKCVISMDNYSILNVKSKVPCTQLLIADIDKKKCWHSNMRICWRDMLPPPYSKMYTMPCKRTIYRVHATCRLAKYGITGCKFTYCVVWRVVCFGQCDTQLRTFLPSFLAVQYALMVYHRVCGGYEYGQTIAVTTHGAAKYTLYVYYKCWRATCVMVCDWVSAFVGTAPLTESTCASNMRHFYFWTDVIYSCGLF